MFIAGLRPLESSTKEAGRAQLRLLESSQKDAGCYVHRRAKAVRIEHKRSWPSALTLLESSQKDAGCYVHRRAEAVRIKHKRSWPGAAEAAGIEPKRCWLLRSSPGCWQPRDRGQNYELRLKMTHAAQTKLKITCQCQDQRNQSQNHPLKNREILINMHVFL
jgi:hypothetical protein